MTGEMEPFHLIEWKAFFERRPFGYEREDLIRAIHVLSVIRGYRGGDVTEKELMPYTPKSTEIFLTPEQVKERFARGS